MSDSNKQTKRVTRGDTFNSSLLDVDYIRQHFEKGLDLPELLKHYGINRVTFYRAMTDRPEVREAWRIGRLAFVASLDDIIISIVKDQGQKTSDRINAYNAYLKYSTVPKEREREEARLEAESLSNEELINKLNQLSNDPLRARLESLSPVSPIEPEPIVQAVNLNIQEADDWDAI